MIEIFKILEKGIPTRLCIALSFFSAAVSLTPPRILYGGWTPIIPGHPFYFGPRRMHIEQFHQQPRYAAEHGPLAYQQQTPGHEREQHFEHHIEFVEPKQYQRPNIYPSPKDPSKVQYIFPSDLNKGIRSEYQSTYKGDPIVGTQFSHTGGEKTKGIYPYNPHHVTFDGHQEQISNKGQPVILTGYKSNEDINNYNPPQAHYGTSHAQKSVKDQYISFDPKPDKTIQNQYPQSVYGGHKSQKHVSNEQISYGHKPNKNIYNYYPPQSAYDEPKLPKKDYKPLYFENPRKPIDILEIPGQKVPILPSTKGLPFKTLSLHNLGPIGNLGDKTYYRIAPLNPNALKNIGEANLRAIQYLGHLKSPTIEKYPVLKDSSGGVPEYSKTAPPAFPTYGKFITPAAKPNYETNGIFLTQNFLGKEESPVATYLRRPLNPIETKKIRELPIYTPQNLNHETLPLSSISKIPSYPSSPISYSSLKYPIKPFGISKSVLSPIILGNGLTNQYQKLLGPKTYSYKSPVVQPFYPKAPVTTAIYPYRSVTKPLVHIPPLQTVPKLLTNNYPKMQTLYKDPSIVTSLRGSPALVEREVAVIHLPASQGQARYPVEKDYLFYTASTPESTLVYGDENLHNRSISAIDKGRHIVIRNNRSSTTPLFHHDNDDSLEQSISHDDSDGSHRGLSTPHIDDNRVDNKQRFSNSPEYIFVSGTDIQDDPEAKKQFFHAYYAPGDHVAPPGYVRMTLREFDDLFRNAEIRYVDKDPTSQDGGQQNS